MLGKLGLAQETAFGSAAAPAVFAAVRSESFSMNNNLLQPSRVDGRRSAGRAVAGRVTADGGIAMDFVPDGAAPWLLKGLFGSVSSGPVDTGVYEHVFGCDETGGLPSFTVRVDQVNGCQDWLGCTVDSATLSGRPGGLVEMDVELKAQRPATAESVTAVYSQTPAFNATHLSFAFNGEQRTDFENLRLTIRNNVEGVHTLNGSRWVSKNVPGRFEVQGAVTFAFASDADRRMFWGGAAADTPQVSIEPGSLTVSAEHTSIISGGYEYRFEIGLPEIYYATAAANISAARDRILQTVVFYAAFNEAGAKMAELKLRNGDTSYPDPA